MIGAVVRGYTSGMNCCPGVYKCLEVLSGGDRSDRSSCQRVYKWYELLSRGIQVLVTIFWGV